MHNVGVFSRANPKHGEQIVENDHVQRAIDKSSPISL